MGDQPCGVWIMREACGSERRCGILGPVRSMSRMPTLMVGDKRVRVSASWRVVLDLPTPPLPERILERS